MTEKMTLTFDQTCIPIPFAINSTALGEAVDYINLVISQFRFNVEE